MRCPVAFGAAAVAEIGDVMTDAGARSSGVFTDLHWEGVLDRDDEFAR